MKGRVCLISGVGPGTGRAIALRFARAGADLVITSRTESLLQELAAEVSAAGARVLAVTGDVTRAEDRDRLLAATTSRFGGVDVLVNNAFATGRPGPIDSVSISKAWNAAFQVNLFATLELSQAVASSMKARGGGAIVMLGTLAAVKPVAGLAAYGASKAALLAAARSLALELGRHQIRVNTVVPGHIDGPSLRQHFELEAARLGISVEQARAAVVGDAALQRLATPEEVAEAVAFFASSESSAITGQALHVNGGQFFAV